MRGSRVLHVPNLLCLPFLSLTLKLKQKSVTSTVPFETYKQLHPTLSLFHSNYAFRHIHTDTFSFSLRKLCYTLPTSKVCRTCIHWSGELPCRYNNFDFSGFNSLSFFFFFLNSTWIFVITAIFDSSLCNTFCYSVFYKTTDWWENNWYQILGFVDSMICLILLFELDWFTSLPVMHKISKLFLLLNRIKPRSPTSWLALFSVFWTI